MMRYVEFTDALPRRLPFYLTAEEYVASRYAAGGDLFFMWRVDPTVIFGRNQLIDVEVDVDYCRANGIEVYRRKSGGGAVYADRDNIMLSYITLGGDLSGTFSRYTSGLADMLRSLGLDASASERNDLLIGGRKVSGGAFYRNGAYCISHSTMLFRTDADTMDRTLRPSVAKMQSKGVQSVRSRVTTIAEHLPGMEMAAFMQHLRQTLCGREAIRLTPGEEAEIERLSAPYYTEEWIRQRSPRGELSRVTRIEGVGEFHVDLTTRRGRIHTLGITGDFFLTGDIDALLIQPLLGTPFTPEGVAGVMAAWPPGRAVAGLTSDAVIRLLFG